LTKGGKMGEEQSVSRRNFLSTATWAIGGFIGIAFVVPAIAYIIGPALQKKNIEEWIRLGSTQKVVPGTPTLFKATIERQAGWITNEEEISVYVLTDNGRDYISMSNICTHLGCRVRWISDQSQFYCPCHNGVFDKNGNVVSGPPPNPLNRYDTKVENDQIFIKAG
jgi:quinol---cytochrome c reductase iron-sulfur subunit, bacillus type